MSHLETTPIHEGVGAGTPPSWGSPEAGLQGASGWEAPLGAAGGLWADLAVPRQTSGRPATSCTTQAVLRSLFRAGEALFFQGPETGIYVFPARQAQTLPPFSFSLKK